jgi:hypothetical protein
MMEQNEEKKARLSLYKTKIRSDRTLIRTAIGYIQRHFGQIRRNQGGC